MKKPRTGHKGFPRDARERSAADAVPAFTMQALVRQTGIAPDTLRAWERRYGFPDPARSAGGHRLYSARDVEAIRWVIQKQREGLRAKQAIDLWKREAQPAPEPALRGERPVLSEGEAMVRERLSWVQSCLSFVEPAATQNFNHACAMLGPEGALLNVVTAGMAQVGEQWKAGTASVAQEHFASALAMQHVQSMLNGEAPATRSEKLFVCCPDGEIHVFPSLVLTYLLRRRGWPVIFLNASLPLPDLLRTVEREQPVMVLSCVQTLVATGALLAQAEALGATTAQFAFGGSVFVRYPRLIERVPGVYLGNRLSEASDAVQRVLHGQASLNVPAPPEPGTVHLGRLLPGALLQVRAEVLGQADAIGMNRADAEAELELIGAYVSNLARLGAPEMLPGVWAWSEQMLRARGVSPDAQQRFHAAVRQCLRAALGPDASMLL